jgi:isoleucyl-tRNA synthetase
MDYRSTLNLPKTAFPMKANLPQSEPAILKLWDKIDIYGLLRQKGQGREKFILHDGPPYANGDIHMGHVLNKVLKDIIIKYKSMRGYDCPFVPGWDCHGLPVEHALFKELGINKHQIDKLDFRKKAHDFAMKFVQIQKEQFKRLGIFGRWERPYLTLMPQYEAEIIRAFKELVRGGYIYKGMKPVNWCYQCETALAEAEVEYADRISPSIYVKFKLLDSGQLRNAYLIIWTTTPWTLLANIAIALHPDMEYALFEQPDGNVYIIAQDLVDQVKHITGDSFDLTHPIGRLAGRFFEGKIYQHPLVSRKGKVVLADYVSNLEGTGCVHTAPGHGREDYETGLKYNLDVIMPVDEKGRFFDADSVPPQFFGINVHKADKLIIDKLKESGHLLFETEVSHSYPHCWRCKGPIIFRATWQWFMNVSHNDLRTRMLEAIREKVNWIPKEGMERISGMVSLRPDWCLSRQRFWGVPIPALYCRQCGQPILDEETIEKFASIAETEGSNAWFSNDLDRFKSRGLRCTKCGGEEFRREEDIIDVWFDSGVSYRTVLKKGQDLEFPADLYLEGSDQHRGWFQSALIPAMATEGRPPYLSVLTHGFVVDGQGKKMSKSLGNVISPQEVIGSFGAEVLRLWAAFCDYMQDVRLSDEILRQLGETYRKIRNTLRFMLGNTFDYGHGVDRVPFDEMLELDRWALQQGYLLLEDLEKNYDSFHFYRVCQAIYNFCNTFLSNFYLDVLKDRLYIYPKKSRPRRSAQSALFELMILLVKAIAPILSFTSEEVWQIIISREDLPASVHLSDWPDRPPAELFDKELDRRWNFFLKLREEAMRLLETQRQKGTIGSSLEAKIILYLKDEPFTYSLLKKYEHQLRHIFIVSQLSVEETDKFPEGVLISEEIEGLALGCEVASGNKCQRCWNYSPQVGADQDYPDICERCVEILKALR